MFICFVLVVELLQMVQGQEIQLIQSFAKKCKNEFKAVYSFKYHKYHINEEGFLSYNGKRLYIPCEIKIC